jgi:hypothetical protein
MTTLVQYFIPEDREEQEKPNAFIVYKEINSLKIQDIKDNFPIPGDYHFRFKFKFQGKNIWIDFNNPDQVLPQFEGKIIMKVTRISWYSESEKSNENNFANFI